MWNAIDYSSRKGSVLAIVIPFSVALFSLAAMFLYLTVNSKRATAANSVRAETYQRQTDAAHAAAQGLSRQSLSNILFSVVTAGIQGNNRVNLNHQASVTEAIDADYASGGIGSVSFTTSSGNAADPSSDLLAALAMPYVSLPFPDIRFSPKPTGAAFIAKRFDYGVVTSYAQNDNISASPITSQETTESTQSLTLYEVPTQFAVDGGDVTITKAVNGSVLARNVVLRANVGGTVAAEKSVEWNAGISVDGVSLPARTGNGTGFIEALNHSTGLNFKKQVTLLEAQSSVQWIPLGDRSLDSEGIPMICRTPATSTDWDVYTHPYFSTSVRIRSTTPISRSSPPLFSTLPCYISAGDGSAGQRRGEMMSSPTFGEIMTASNGYLPASGVAIMVVVDVSNIPVISGTRTLFVDLVSDYAASPRKSVLIGLKNADNLTSPFSLVSANPVVFLGNFNSTGMPASIIAPAVLHSLSPVSPQVTFTGLRSSIRRNVPMDPFSVQAGNTTIAAYSITLADVNGTNPANLPPVTLKNWLIVLGAPQ